MRKGVPGNYPVHRETCHQPTAEPHCCEHKAMRQPLSAERISIKGQRIPPPPLLRRFAGHGTWNEHFQAIMGLTKMNCNNDALCDRQPMRLAYAHVLARFVRAIHALSERAIRITAIGREAPAKCGRERRASLHQQRGRVPSQL